MKSWTQEEIYVEGRRNLPTLVDLKMIGSMPYVFTKKFMADYHGEKTWERIGSRQRPDMRKVAWGTEPCPICGEVEGAGAVSLQVRGADTGITVFFRVECQCFRFRIYHQVIASAKLPVTMRDARLATLKPSDKVLVSIDRQKVVAGYLREHKDDSHLLSGVRRSGKSHLAAAVFGDVVAEWIESGKARTSACPATIISAEKLIAEWMDHARADEKQKVTPTVTEELVAAAVKAGLKPVLIIEDIDRMKITEARLVKLAAIIDWYRREGGRIVTTSTLTDAELMQKWGKTPGADDLITWLRYDVVPVNIGDRAENGTA